MINYISLSNKDKKDYDEYFINGIKINGLTFLENIYKEHIQTENKNKNINKYLITYSLLYIKLNNNNLNDIIQSYIHTDNSILNLIFNYIISKTNKYLNLIKYKYLVKALYENVINLKIKNQIAFYLKIFNNKKLKNIFIKLYWKNDNKKLSILANIIKKINLNNKFNENINEICEFINLIDKNIFTEWLKNIIKQNLKNNTVNNIINDNNNFIDIHILIKLSFLLINILKLNNNCNFNTEIFVLDLNFINNQNTDINHLFWDTNDRLSNNYTTINIDELNDNWSITYYTKIYIYLSKLIEISWITLIFKIKYLSSQIKIFKNIIEMESSSLRWSSTSIYKEFYINFYKKKLNKYLNIKNNDEKYFISENVLPFINYYTEITSQLYNNYKYDYKALPKSILNNNILLLSKIKNFSSNSFLILINNILNNKYKLDKNIYKSIFISLNLCCITDNINLKNIVNQTITYYIKNLNNSYDLIENYKFKYKFNILIKSLFKNNLLDNINTNSIIKFINIIIRDNNSILDSLLIIINNIYFYTDNSLDVETKIVYEQYLIKEKVLLRKYLKYFQENFNMINLLFTFNISYFSNDINCNTYIKSLNYFLYKINNEEINQFKFNKYNIEFTWKYILEKIHNIYSTFYNKKKFIKSIANEKIYYKERYLYDLDLNKSINKKWSNLGKIRLLIIEIIKISQNKQSIKLPTKFCDPILFTPIINPVVLPSSNLVIDKINILNHLIHSKSDPFNRDFLNEELLFEFNNKKTTKLIIKKFLDEKELWLKNNLN